MNEVYEVKLQAASLSIFNQNKLQISESTTPRQVSEEDFPRTMKNNLNILHDFTDFSSSKMWASNVKTEGLYAKLWYYSHRDSRHKLLRVYDNSIVFCLLAVSSKKMIVIQQWRNERSRTNMKHNQCVVDNKQML